ncbi:UNVERIFIED_CONTAM: putative DNA primase large subunit, partial [Sesamum radiatum]
MEIVGSRGNPRCRPQETPSRIFSSIGRRQNLKSGSKISSFTLFIVFEVMCCSGCVLVFVGLLRAVIDHNKCFRTVLKGISDGLSRGKKPNEMEELVNELWEVNMKRSEASEFVNKDIISHFVLRLVYCREEELRKWFLSMETTLFRYRFQRESPEAQRALLAEFNLPYKAVSSAEYESVKDKLKQAARSSGQSLPSEKFQGQLGRYLASDESPVLLPHIT